MQLLCGLGSRKTTSKLQHWGAEMFIFQLSTNVQGQKFQFYGHDKFIYLLRFTGRCVIFVLDHTRID